MRREPQQGGGRRGNDIPIDELPSGIILSSQLPDEITGRVVSARVDTDRFGRTIVKLRVLIVKPDEHRGSYTVLTYPPSLIKYFKQASKNLNIKTLGEYVGKTIRFKRISFDTEPYRPQPRHFPIEIVLSREEEAGEEGEGEESGVGEE